jgi:hypothetical protein
VVAGGHAEVVERLSRGVGFVGFGNGFVEHSSLALYGIKG